MNLKSVHNSSKTPTFSLKELTAELSSSTRRATFVRSISVLEAFIKKPQNSSPNLVFALLWYRYIYGFKILNLISTDGQKIC